MASFSPLNTSFQVYGAFRKRARQCSFQAQRKQLPLRYFSNIDGVLGVQRDALRIMSSAGKYRHFNAPTKALQVHASFYEGRLYVFNL